MCVCVYVDKYAYKRTRIKLNAWTNFHMYIDRCIITFIHAARFGVRKGQRHD